MQDIFFPSTHAVPIYQRMQAYRVSLLKKRKKNLKVSSIYVNVNRFHGIKSNDKAKYTQILHPSDKHLLNIETSISLKETNKPWTQWHRSVFAGNNLKIYGV
jgi:hypothetical protein